MLMESNCGQIEVYVYFVSQCMHCDCFVYTLNARNGQSLPHPPASYKASRRQFQLFEEGREGSGLNKTSTCEREGSRSEKEGKGLHGVMGA